MSVVEKDSQGFIHIILWPDQVRYLRDDIGYLVKNRNPDQITINIYNELKEVSE